MTLAQILPFMTLAVVVVSYEVRLAARRRRDQNLVTWLHRRGQHEAAHKVRLTILPGEPPTVEQLKLERGLPEYAPDEALLDIPKRGYCGIAECPNTRPHSHAADLRRRLKEDRERQ